MSEAKHPGGRPSKDRVKRTYTIDREVAEFIDKLSDGERSNFVSASLKQAKERQESMNAKLREVAEQAIQQAHDEGLDDEDAAWMAVGAINREARNQGVIGEELLPEFNAAAQAIVNQVQ